MLFGSVVALLGEMKSELVTTLILVLFGVCAFVGVIGITQLREMYEERRRRGLGWFGVMIESQDFTRFYLPTWGRMFVWFIATAVAAFSTKALFS